MEAIWYGSQADAIVDGCNIGALAVVAPLFERMNVAGIIDQHLPADRQAEFAHGAVLTALIAARMDSPLALVNVGNGAAELLWNIPAMRLTDDRMGKSLDARAPRHDPHDPERVRGVHVANHSRAPGTHRAAAATYGSSTTPAQLLFYRRLPRSPA